jgi:hypothetical protein
MFDPRNFSVQSIPGLTLAKTVKKLRDGTLSVEDQEFILIAIGTNEVELGDIPQAQRDLVQILQFIQAVNPYGTIGIASIIPRKKDITDEGMQSVVIEMNCMFKHVCRARGLDYAESWKCLLKDDKSLDGNMFARDDLHLKDNGVQALKIYFQGYFTTMQQRKYENDTYSD